MLSVNRKDRLSAESDFRLIETSFSSMGCNNFWSSVNLALNLEGDWLDGENNEDFSLCFQFISKCLTTDALFILESFFKKRYRDVKEASWMANILVLPVFERRNQNSLRGRRKAGTFNLSPLISYNACHFLKTLCLFSKVFGIGCFTLTYQQVGFWEL